MKKPKERNKAVPAVYLFLMRGNEILLALRKNTGYQDGNWNVPSGHIEAGELPRAALIREIEKKLGLKLGSKELELVHVLYRTKHDETGDRVDYFFQWKGYLGETDIGDGIENMEPDKCAELRWFPLYRLPKNMTPHVRHAIDCMEQSVLYSELDRQWLREHGVPDLGREPVEIVD